MDKHLTHLAEVRITTDVVIFTVDENSLKVLLLYRHREPYSGQLALPGGFIWNNETSAEAALRVLRSKTHVDSAFIEQLYTFDEPKRDPRGHIVSIAYFALMPAEKLVGHGSIEQVALRPVSEVSGLAFDHDRILDFAVKRLRSKLAYSNIAYSLLPEYFTLSQLQSIYEVIIGRQVDKRNFRKKINSLNIIVQTDRKQTGGRHRPAMLYRFKNQGYTELAEPIF